MLRIDVQRAHANGDDRDQHLLREIVDDVAKDLLVLPHPSIMRQIGDRLILSILVLRDHELLWFDDSVVQIAIEPGTKEVLEDMCLPQQVVLGGELLADLGTKTRESRGVGGGQHGGKDGNLGFLVFGREEKALMTI